MKPVMTLLNLLPDTDWSITCGMDKYGMNLWSTFQWASFFVFHLIHTDVKLDLEGTPQPGWSNLPWSCLNRPLPWEPH